MGRQPSRGRSDHDPHSFLSSVLSPRQAPGCGTGFGEEGALLENTRDRRGGQRPLCQCPAEDSVTGEEGKEGHEPSQQTSWGWPKPGILRGPLGFR